MSAPVVALQNVTISMIKPAEKTEHPSVLEAVVFDLLPLDAYVPVALFYEPDDRLTSNFYELLDCIKKSLSEVLVPYFPFAGRWMRTHDERLRELLCSDEGVPFIEAFIDEDMESFVETTAMVVHETNTLRSCQFMGFDPTRFGQDIDSPSQPPLYVQVTQFKCGGVALTATIYHMIADGTGMTDFMKSWSEIALNSRTSTVPRHDRSLITFFTAMESQTFRRLVFDKASVPGPHTAKQPDFEKVLHVKRTIVDELKQQAIQSNTEPRTTVDIISAHIWRSLNSLPNSSGNKVSEIRASTLMEGRRRWHNPPLPRHYSGNILGRVWFPPSPPAELSTKSLLAVAGVVHETVSSINPSSARCFLSDYLKTLDSQVQTESPCVLISSWFRFPLYEVSFGHGYGNPTLASPIHRYHNAASFEISAIVCPPPPAISKDAIATVHIFVPASLGHMKEGIFFDENFLSLFTSL